MATSTERVKIYINGVLQTLTAAGGGAPSQNLQTELNNNTTRYIGTYKASSGYKDGYLAEFYLLDGYSTNYQHTLVKLIHLQTSGNH